MLRGIPSPDFTTQDATTYKASIDHAVEALIEMATPFFVHAATPAGMSVVVEGGYTPAGAHIGPWTLADIGAPTQHPRRDVIYLDLNTGNLARAVGNEAPSPSLPAVPFGVLILAVLHLTPTTTVITQDLIEDRRVTVGPHMVFATGGYTYLVDPDGLYRFIIGRNGIDNRIILKMHGKSGSSAIEFQNADGAVIARLSDQGDLHLKGKLTQEAAL